MKLRLAAPYIIAVVIVAFAMWAKYKTGVGIFFEIANHGFDGPVWMGIGAILIGLVIWFLTKKR